VIVNNKILEIKVSEFIEVINENPDKSSENVRINGILIGIVQKNKNRLTVKQKKWVLGKLEFIIRKNKKLKLNKYLNIPNFTDIKFVNETGIVEDRNFGFNKFLN
jgi:hypothetical protein